MDTRVCKWCNNELPISNFGKHKNSKDGYRVSCKECTNIRNQRNKNRIKDTFDPLNRKWLHENLDRTAKCKNCGGFFETKPGRGGIEKFCTKECSYEYNYINQKDTIKKKAIVLGANLLMGKGKLEWLKNLISTAIGNNCIYCGCTLSIDNLSIDHKEAYGSSDIRKNKIENKEIRKHLDRRENLHIVCKDCNSMKREIDHLDYVDLLSFFKDHPKAAESIKKRLRMANAPFGKRRQQ